MKSNLLALFVFIMASTLVSCTTLHLGDGSPIYIKHRDHLYELSNDADLHVSLPFSIIFENQEYNFEFHQYVMRIGAFSNEILYQHIDIGMNLLTLPAFYPGTGMASEKGELTVNNIGHHFLYFTLSDTSRLNILKVTPDLVYTLEYPVNVINRPPRTKKFPIYLVLINDRDLNNIVDFGELTKLKLYVDE